MSNIISHANLKNYRIVIIYLSYLKIGQNPVWTSSTDSHATIEDAPQLEYDEHDIHLIADRGKFLSI